MKINYSLSVLKSDKLREGISTGKYSFLLISFFCSLYTIARYVIFAGVDPIHMPLFLANKAIAMAAALFLFCTALNNTRGNFKRTAYWGRTSLDALRLHILMSLILYSQAYYGKFFIVDGKMNLTGELMLLFGILAAYAFWAIRGPVLDDKVRLRFLHLIASGLVALHLLVMGWAGWLKIDKWPGGLPPISLLSFIFAISSVWLFLQRPKQLRKL